MQVFLALLVSSSALLLLQLHGCCASAKAWKVLKNDATELLPENRERSSRAQQEPTAQSSNNHTINNNNNNNRAKHGGRNANTVSYSASELSCRELRSTRYITDGSCRSAKPVKELVCSGQCMPAHLLPNSILRGKWWRSSTLDYRCIPAHSRTQRVQLHCPNGNTRTYKIRAVTACKCKRYRREHNQSDTKEVPKPQRSKKHSRSSQDRSKSNAPLTNNSY
ncbi:sclerostin [Thalassophryne amazonica]|uniref:sclerostin n=1 Tax=Thalassophryne amazonica TaxID=390379 RepID=UPI0014714934|nr:sclerostin [Thalassophryne amazonica]